MPDELDQVVERPMMPTLEYPAYETPEREYGAPEYRGPVLSERLPSLRGDSRPGLPAGPARAIDRVERRRGIDAATQLAGAGGRRKVQSAVDRALAYGRKDPKATGDVIANQGTALANTMGGAGAQARKKVGVGEDYAFRTNVVNYDRQINDVFTQHAYEMDEAKKNFGTLSGVYDADLKSAEIAAKRNHEAKVRDIQMNFDADLQAYLLSGVKTVTQINTRR